MRADGRQGRAMNGSCEWKPKDPPERTGLETTIQGLLSLSPIGIYHPSPCNKSFPDLARAMESCYTPALNVRGIRYMDGDCDFEKLA